MNFSRIGCTTGVEIPPEDPYSALWCSGKETIGWTQKGEKGKRERDARERETEGEKERKVKKKGVDKSCFVFKLHFYTFTPFFIVNELLSRPIDRSFRGRRLLARELPRGFFYVGDESGYRTCA